MVLKSKTWNNILSTIVVIRYYFLTFNYIFKKNSFSSTYSIGNIINNNH